MSTWMDTRRAEAHRQVRRWQATWLGVALLIAAILVYQSGCGPSARHVALVSEYAALNTARDLYTKWDIEFQRAIKDKSKAEGVTRDIVKARIAAYRSTIQVAILRAFALAYGELAAAFADDQKPIPRAPNSVTRGVQSLKPGQDPPGDFVFVTPPAFCDPNPCEVP